MNDNEPRSGPVLAFTAKDFIVGLGVAMLAYVLLTAALVLAYGWPQ